MKSLSLRILPRIAVAVCTFPPCCAHPAPRPAEPSPGNRSPFPSCMNSIPTSPSASSSRTASCSSCRKITSCPSSPARCSIPGGSRDEDPAKAGLVSLYGAGLAHQRHRQNRRRRPRRSARSQGRAHRDRGRRGLDRGLMGFAEGRHRPGVRAGHGPALHPKFNAEKLQLAQQQEATGIVRRNDDEVGHRRARGSQAGLRRQQPLHAPARTGHHRRGHARRPAGLARPHHRRQTHRRRQRRLRPCGDGSQAARGL